MRKVSLIALLVVFIIACSSESVQELSVPPNNCNTEDISYDNELAALITNSCATVGCHVGPNGIGGLDLSRYEDVKQIAGNGNLIGRINGTTGAIMPPGGKLPPCEINKITSWVQDGARRN